MIFRSDRAVLPSPAHLDRSFLRSPRLGDFWKVLLMVFGLEASIPVVSSLAITFWHFPPYVIDIPAVALLSLSLSFSLTRRTGKMGLSLWACLLTSLGYIVGFLIVSTLIGLLDFFSMLDSYDGIGSMFGFIFYVIETGIILILTVLGCGAVSILGGLLGAWLEKWQARRFLKPDGKDGSDALQLNLSDEQAREYEYREYVTSSTQNKQPL